MTAKTLLTALVLAAAPTFAAAAGCSWGSSQSAASCADGTVWDAAAQRCVTATTS